MDEKPETLRATTLGSESSQEKPTESADLATISTSTSAPVSLGSETTILAEACELAQGEPRREFIRRFLQMVHETDFEFGFSTPADRYVGEALDAYGPFARQWVNELFLRNFGDPFVTCAILRVIAHFDYQQMYPQGMTMAIAGTGHADVGVRECAVRCFENWETAENLAILRNLSFPEGWLREYLEDVISDLEALATDVVAR